MQRAQSWDEPPKNPDELTTEAAESCHLIDSVAVDEEMLPYKDTVQSLESLGGSLTGYEDF